MPAERVAFHPRLVFSMVTVEPSGFWMTFGPCGSAGGAGGGGGSAATGSGVGAGGGSCSLAIRVRLSIRVSLPVRVSRGAKRGSIQSLASGMYGLLRQSGRGGRLVVGFVRKMDEKICES